MEWRINMFNTLINALKTALTFQDQADVAISQNNPVSDELYEVLPTTLNVRIISIGAVITWATTQPTPLDIVVTVDGQSLIFRKTNPVTNVGYEASFILCQADIQQSIASINLLSSSTPYRAFLLEGRSVRVQVRVTWATTQPTPLVCRVKWAKR
jgi:hypothetical protein